MENWTQYRKLHSLNYGNIVVKLKLLKMDRKIIKSHNFTLSVFLKRALRAGLRFGQEFGNWGGWYGPPNYNPLGKIDPKFEK